AAAGNLIHSDPTGGAVGDHVKVLRRVQDALDASGKSGRKGITRHRGEHTAGRGKRANTVAEVRREEPACAIGRVADRVPCSRIVWRSGQRGQNPGRGIYREAGDHRPHVTARVSVKAVAAEAAGVWT